MFLIPQISYNLEYEMSVFLQTFGYNADRNYLFSATYYTAASAWSYLFAVVTIIYLSLSAVSKALNTWNSYMYMPLLKHMYVKKKIVGRCYQNYKKMFLDINIYNYRLNAAE